MLRAILGVVFALAGCKGTDEEHCFLGDIDPTTVVEAVQVDTLTGDRGTDSDVYLDIEFEEGDDVFLYLDNADDTCEPGAGETFVVPVTPFLAGNVASMEMRKESSLFEAGDRDLEALTITFIDEDGVGWVVYDNPGPVERMTGDETEDLRCF